MPQHGLCRHNERPTATGAWWVPTGFRAYHLDAPIATGLANLLGPNRHVLLRAALAEQMRGLNVLQRES